MRRPPFAVLIPAICSLALIIPASPAAAREPVGNQPLTLAPNRCGFPIDVAVVQDNEYQDVTTLADGTTITNVRGKLVESFTNHNTGKTIVRNVSGPTTETDYPNGTATFVGRGNNWFGFDPISQGNTGEPGLVFTSGPVTLQIGSGGVTSFSLSGKQVNGCALLS